MPPVERIACRAPRRAWRRLGTRKVERGRLRNRLSICLRCPGSRSRQQSVDSAKERHPPELSISSSVRVGSVILSVPALQAGRPGEGGRRRSQDADGEQGRARDNNEAPRTPRVCTRSTMDPRLVGDCSAGADRKVETL